MPRAFADIAFTPAVRNLQKQQGSAKSYAKLLSPDADGGDTLTMRETAFIAERDGFYQATVSETGWPYVQFRGGPRGFLKVLDEKTIAYADFRGNRQYISVGNLSKEPRISLILMDYPNRRRLKIWGETEVIDKKNGKLLTQSFYDPSYPATIERVFVVAVTAFDWNCPSHIPQRFTLDELEKMNRFKKESVQDN